MGERICSFHRELEEPWRSEVFSLLTRCDSEFVPPLSERTSTHQMSFTPEADRERNILKARAMQSTSLEPERYFTEMAGQHFILATEKDLLLGFLSYIDDYRLPYLDEKSTYVSTVCTDPAFRGQGVATDLYAYLEREIHPAVISLRTWSTNDAQLHLLEKRNYEVIARVPDDRGPGIDSIYLVKYTESTL